MFKKILLAATLAEDSRGAANLSFALARPSSSRLFVFHAYGPDEAGWSSIRHLSASGKVKAAEEQIIAGFEEALDAIENYTITVVPGVPHEEILRFARKKQADLIVMGPHRVRADQPRIWGMTGSTLQKVSLRARCPVMIVPPDVPRIYPSGHIDLSEADRANFHILIVDDELSLRDSLKEWLSEEGFSAHTAASGEEALEILAAKPCHLMLTDIRMPGMDGVALLHQAKKKHPELAVVMMTAYATIDTAVDAMKQGALDYLVKPFDPELLIPKVRKIHEDYEVTRGRLKVAFSNIVLATDFSRPAHCAFNFAADIARFYEARLHIFHALPMSEETSAGCSQELIEKNIADALARMKQDYLPPLKDAVPFSLESWEGVPHMEILKFARWRHADLIIMAHHSREKDPEKALLGSTVIKVASGARCPVLSINRDFMPSCGA